MADEVSKKVLAFVAGECARDGYRSAVKFELTSAAVGGRGQPIATWEREENPTIFEPGNAHALANQIIDRAQDFADGSGPTSHRFVVIATQHLGGTQRHPFRMQGAAMDGDGNGGEDEPTAQGLVAQSMRHAEFFAQLAMRSMQATNITLAKRLDANEDYIAKLVSDRREHEGELEAARSGAHQRDMEAMDQIAKNTRKDKVFENVAKLAPAIVNRFMGHKVLTEGKTPKEQMLESLAKSLTDNPERLGSIMGALAQVLQPQELIIVAELIKTSQPEPPPAANGVNGHAQQGD